ncbi:MAG: ABC transporter ATP-binding protein [Actinomycetia bacterium]|nr:ABC transporter ATP-binding protein [Actinomycetes bacterium]
MENNNSLLRVEDLKTYFYSKEGTVRAVDGVNISIKDGETLGIAGESGCGKSVTAQSILRLIPKNGRIESGRILLRGDGKYLDLVPLKASGRKIRSIRGKEISIVFQEPMTSLSMVYTIGNQIMEAIMLHQKCTRKEARERTLKLLGRVGLPAAQVIDAYPFALSGGMRQRALIAMALSCKPRLLIADEPTTAVDVTIQAQILKLLKEIQKNTNMALIMITHDLAVLSELCDRVMIMYLGKDIENATTKKLFKDPKHPYTIGLLKSVPRLGVGSREKIEAIKGTVPSGYDLPKGCSFHPRCPEFMPGRCDKEFPKLVEVDKDHNVSCFLYQ